MSLTKQAKVLSKAHVNVLSAFIAQTRYPVRNQAVLMLSVKAGLRAKEIANLTWDMVTDPDGILASAIHLRDCASKGRSGRVIPLNRDLRAALEMLRREAEYQKQSALNPNRRGPKARVAASPGAGAGPKA